MDKAYLKELAWAIKAELIKFRFMIVSAFAVITLLVVAIGLIIPKNYQTSAMLYADVTNIIEPAKGNTDNNKINRAEQARQIIYTRVIMEAVARKLNLFKSGMTPDEEEKVIKALRTNLTVKPEKDRNFFTLSYSASNPDKSFDVLNAIVNEFISYTEKEKREKSSTAYNFIDAQVQSYKRQLETAEDKLKEFNSQNVDGNETQVSGRITQLNTDIEALKISIEESQAKMLSLQQQLGAEGQYQHAKGQADELKQRRISLNRQLEQLLLTYQENYPDVVSIKTQIAEIDEAVKKIQVSGDVFSNAEKVENPLYEEIRKQISLVDVDLRSQRRKLESLLKLLDQERQRAERIASNQAELADLTRDYDVTKKVYEEMLQRKETARLSMTLDQQGQGVSYRIQEPATFPLSPAGLNFIHFAIAAPVLGILIPLGVIVAVIMVDPHIRSARTLMQQLPPEIELLGVIPHYNSALGERLLRKDMLIILTSMFLFLVAYVAFASYWQVVMA